eukprot:TRINITY_DN6221_c0_g1_i1.p2 TRINITY_DN6221_c0_g1~~TRINITY_DN6221_c0_g1_i1.p2  ORF type:complete len:247 (+),score=38.69 TRINITY_DN6221_c0_g1_i1:64-804(+)
MCIRDSFNNKTHILYLTTGGYVYYLYLEQNGTVSSALNIGKSTQRGQGVISIQGANDGLHLYVVINYRRGYYDDLNFLESENDGHTWSSPVIPRSNNLQDSYNRYIPEILVLSSGRVFIFYSKNSYNEREIMATTRPPNSIAWSTEKYVAERSGSKLIAHGIIGEKAPRSTIYIELVQEELGVRVCTTDFSGNQWSCENTIKDKDVLRSTYAALTKQDFNKTLYTCLLYTSPSPRDQRGSRMPSSA